MGVVDLVVNSAKVPSFSTYEERLHPYIVDKLNAYKNVNLVKIKDNNLLLEVGGREGVKPVAITSHLDKINHYGEQYPGELDVVVEDGQIKGQMDDAAGIGICLQMIELAQKRAYPPLVILFSEMEESTGLREHPHLLKNDGKDVGPQIGAHRLSQYIDAEGIEPAAFITIDTTPVFKGDSGVALYTEHWEKTSIMPDSVLENKIEKLKSFILSCDDQVILANGNNDYLVYGKYFGVPEKGNVPSIAIEPAIFPYHQIGEGVFVDDINRIVSILDKMLSDFDFGFNESL